MKFFNSESDEDVIKLLKESKQDFRFGHDRVKDKLLFSINGAPAEAPVRNFFAIRIIKYSFSAVLLIFLSVGFVFASNARPGDRLFALNKFGEKVILSLPLSVEQKALVHAEIVTRRLEALQEIEDMSIDTKLQAQQPETKQVEAKPAETLQPETSQLEARQLETVKESDESIKDAIDTVTKNKQLLESSGKTKTSQKLGRILNHLDDLAKKHEERIKSLEAAVPDNKIKQSIDQHLVEIKNSRHKAREELKLEEETPADPAKPKVQEKKDLNSAGRRMQKKPDDSSKMLKTAE